MINLKNINKTFKDSHNRDVNVLKNISIKFPKTGFFCIVGKSGSGKTTLLNILSGLIKPDKGEYLLFGNDTKEFSEKDWCGIRSKYFSYVFQDYNLLENVSLLENIKLNITDEELDNILKKYDIYELKNKPVYELSGGEAQRAAIVRSVVTKSKIVLADEPTGALDKDNSIVVFETLKAIGKNKLVIVVTHDIEFANKFADGIINLDYGEISSLSIPSTDDYYENLDTSNKLPLKKIKQVGKIILKKNKNKHFLPIILSSIFIAIITFLLNFSFFDPTRYAYDSIVRSDSRVYISEFNKLENFKSNDEYNLFSKEVINDFNLSYAFKDLISDCVINGKKVNAKYLGTIVIDDNLNDYEIVFTDYVLNRLNNKYSFDFSDYDSLINQKISFSDNDNFIIKDVKIYGNDCLIDDFFASSCDITTMNSYTVKKIISLYKEGVVSKEDYNFYRESSLLSENMMLKNNEVYLSNFIIEKIFNSEDYNEYINNQVDLEINGITRTYTIKDVVYEPYAIILSKECYDDLFDSSLIDLNDFDHFYWTKIINYSQYTRILDFMNNNFNKKYNIVHSVNGDVKVYDTIYYVLNTPYKTEIESNISINIGLFKMLSYVLVGIFSFSLILSLMLTNRYYIALNKRSISVLYFLGYDKKSIKLCYHGNNFDLSLISSLIGICLSFAFIPLFNVLINKTFEINFVRTLSVVSLIWGVYPLVFVSFMLISFLLMSLQLKKEFNFNIINLIKGSN